MYRKSMENNMLDKLKEDLVGIDIRFDEPLKRYTYTKVGGPADYFPFHVTAMNSLVLSNLLISMTFLGWCLVMPVT